MAALTLAEYAVDPRPLVAGVAKVLRDESLWMDVLPFPTIASLSVKAIREGAVLPNPSWRQAGNSHSSVKAVLPDEVQEQVFSIGNQLVTDKMYLQDKSPRLYDPVAYQIKMITRGIARNFNNASINGLPGEDNPTGLFYRVMNDLPSDNRITADPAGGSSGLDISPDTALALGTAARQLFDKLDQMLDVMGFGPTVPASGVYLLCNTNFIQRYNSLARYSGLLSTSQDALGRTFMDYRGAKFLDMGYKYDDSTKIIGNAETLAGAALTGGTGTSVYGVRLGSEYFTGWQEYGLEVSPFEPTDDKVTYKSVIDWAVGLALSSKRSVARLYGIIAA